MRRYASSIQASSPQPHRVVSPNGPPASASSRWPRRCAAGCAAPRCWPSRRQPPTRTMGERPPAQHANPAALMALAWVHLEHHELKQTRSRLSQLDAVLAGRPGQTDRGDRQPGRRVQRAGRGTRRHGCAGRGQGAIRLAGSGLARTKAEPGRVPGIGGRGPDPGRARRRRAGRAGQLAGGEGHPRACADGGRGRRQRPAHARTPARCPQQGARPGTPASLPGRRPARLPQRRRGTRPSITGTGAAAGRTRATQAAVRAGPQLDRAGAPARPSTGPHLPASAAAACCSALSSRLRRAPRIRP